MRFPGLLLFLALALPLSAFRLGPEVPLSPLTFEPAPFLRNTAKVASDGDDFLVVWNDIRGFSTEVRATRVRDDGTVLDPASIVIAGGNGQSLSVASNGRNYVVAYACADRVFGGVCLSSVDPETGVASYRGRIDGGMSGAIASDGEGYLIAYQTEANGTRGLFLDEGGSIDGTPFTIGGGAAPPAIAGSSEGYLVVFSTYQQLVTVLVSSDGVLGVPRSIATPATFGPASFGWSAASDGRDFFVAWQQNTGVVNQAYTTELRTLFIRSDGVLGLAQTLVGHEHAWQPAAIWTGSRFMVTYTDSDSRATAPYLFDEVDADVRAVPPNPFGADPPNFPLATRQGRESASAGASNGIVALLVWDHLLRPGAAQIEGRILRRGQVPGDAPLITISKSIPWQESVAGAAVHGVPTVAWQENRGEHQTRKVFLQRIADHGGLLHAPLPVGESGRDQVRPAIGGDTVVWIEEDLGTQEPGKVFLRFIDSDRSLQPPIVVGEAARGSSVAVAAAGRMHLVVWQSPDRDLVAARVSPSGGVLDPLIQVSESDGGSWPVVASDGRTFFVAWRSEWYGEGCGACIPLYALHAAVVSRSGSITRPAFEIDSETSQAAVVWNGTSYVLFWYGSEGMGAQHFSRFGEEIGTHVPLETSGAAVAVTWDGEEYVLVLRNGLLLVASLNRDLRLIQTSWLRSSVWHDASAAVVSRGDGTEDVVYQARVPDHGTSSRIMAATLLEGDPLPRRRAVTPR